MKQRFKKSIGIFLMLMLLVGTINFAQTNDGLKVRQIYQFIAMGTGATTGTYFPLGQAFANVWSARLEKVNIMALSTRGSLENIRMLQKRELDLAIAQSDIVISAVNGTGKFAGAPCADLKVLMALFPEVVQIVVLKSSSINSIEELKGKKIVVGAPGSGNALTAIELLGAAGLNLADFSPIYISYDEAIQPLERREYDAAFVVAGVPTKMISELHQRVPLKVLPFSAEEIERLQKALPYLSHIAIQPGTYAGMNNETQTLALMAMLVSSSRLSDDVVEQLLQTLFNNLDYLQQVHPRARDISTANFLKAVPEGRLHSGSARFLRGLSEK